ncbi:fatty acid desaturase [Arcticibacter sp.]|uniref:fatty acid desaturase n=1 Tax=Arcticibacter sp. TaxID=1872630 RepID=UPI00388D4DF0
MRKASNFGILVALVVISCWALCLFSLLRWNFQWDNPLVYLMILVQTHLYTGLFITAHDAMHGTVSSSRKFNLFIGQLCTALYAAFSFNKLMVKHHEHHRHVHSDLDPDYHEGTFPVWYFHFMKEYMSVLQIVMMAVLFNILTIWFTEVNILVFWVLPALLSTLQLFFFGTWLPHHGEHQNVHHSRSLKKNHLVGFFSCYFFGYHYEHHEFPGTPWWKLWRMK